MDIGRNERISIRPWQMSDAEAWQQTSQDSGLNLNSIRGYKQKDLTGAKIFIRNEIADFENSRLGRWPIVRTSDHALIGTCLLRPVSFDETPERREVELGYRLTRDNWGQGLATECAQMLLNYGFRRVGLENICAFAVADNTASLRVIEKLGFKARGERRFMKHKVLVFDLTAADWERMQLA